MSPWTVYFVFQADRLSSVAGHCAFAASFISLISVFVYCLTKAAFEGDKDADKVCKLSGWIAVFSLPMFILLIFLYAFIPTTKTMCAVVAVPAVVNDETLQADLHEVYTLGMKRIKDELGDPPTKVEP